jgi:zinc protease
MRRSTFALALVLSACSSTQTPPAVVPVPTPPAADAGAPQAAAAPRVAVPTPGPARDVHLPPVRATTLPNGLAVQLVEYHTLPVLHLRLVVRAGSSTDPANLPGLASFTGDMLREGTTTRSSAQIAETIEFVGGSLDVSTSADVTVLSVSVLRDHAETALNLLADVLGHPTFPQVEINKLKRRETDRLQQSRNDPGWLTRRAFYQGLYGEGHPYGRIDTTTQALARLTRADLIAFHRARFVSGNMFLTAVGDVQPAAFDALLNRTLGTLRRGTSPAAPIADPPAATARQIVLVDRPDSAQSVIRIGNVSLRRADPDWVPFTVANQMLGGGVSSRLFMDLRELRSLSYGVYARMGENVGESQWFAGGQVRTAVTADALHALFRHLECLTTEPAPEPELAMTRSYLTDSFALSIETPGNVADLVSAMRIFGLPADYYDTLRARVSAVDAATSLATARRYVHPDHALVVVVGTAAAPVQVGPRCAAAAALPADASFAQQLQACQARPEAGEGAPARETQPLQEVLRSFGPVRVVDLDGHLVRELPATAPSAPSIHARCEELTTPALQAVAHAGQN